MGVGGNALECVGPRVQGVCVCVFIFSNLNVNRPDILIIDENGRKVFILEVGCCFDSSLEEAYLTKLVKYHPLVQQISGPGYICQYMVLISLAGWAMCIGLSLGVSG